MGPSARGRRLSSILVARLGAEGGDETGGTGPDPGIPSPEWNQLVLLVLTQVRIPMYSLLYSI